jgi:hypothetical protein
MKIIPYIITGLSLSCAVLPRGQAGEQILLGAITRQQIEDALPAWKAAVREEPDEEASKALGSIPPGATVTVYLGTWCGDSRRELLRLWSALDLLGDTPPFLIRYIGVDRQKKAPKLPPDLSLTYVPTFVVSRDGRELGRIIESSPRGIEADLRALLTGTTKGIISKRSDLGSL